MTNPRPTPATALIDEIRRALEDYENTHTCLEETCPRCLAIEDVHDHAEEWLAFLLAQLSQVQQEKADQDANSLKARLIWSLPCHDCGGPIVWDERWQGATCHFCLRLREGKADDALELELHAAEARCQALEAQLKEHIEVNGDIRAAVGDWQPIETAPKDGSYIVLVGRLASDKGPVFSRRACVTKWCETAEDSPFRIVGWPFVAPGYSDAFIPEAWTSLPARSAAGEARA